MGCALLTSLLSPARGPVVSTGMWKEGKDKRGMSADGNVRSCTNGAAPALAAWCLPPSSGWWVRAAQRLPRALQDEVSGDAHLHLNSWQVEHVSTFQNLFCFSLRIRVLCFEGRNVFEKYLMLGDSGIRTMLLPIVQPARVLPAHGSLPLSLALSYAKGCDGQPFLSSWQHSNGHSRFARWEAPACWLGVSNKPHRFVMSLGCA